MKRSANRTIFPIVIIMLTLFTSCSNDKEEPIDSLEGTSWSRAVSDYSDEVEHLEFISDTAVECFYTKNGALSSEVSSGTYIKYGSNVKFKNFRFPSKGSGNNIISAKISGKTMILTYTYDNKGSEYSYTYRQDN